MNTAGELTEDRSEPIPPQKLTIFKILPPATEETFKQSLLVGEDSEKLRAQVLYAPDLQNIGCIDNSNSEGSTEYSKSITTGFSLSTAVTLSLNVGAEVNFEVVKASVTVGFSITFTAQYTKETTETITFSVPAKSRAFTYQGYLRTVGLAYDVRNRVYAFEDGTRGHFFTNVVATSKVPLTGAPKLM